MHAEAAARDAGILFLGDFWSAKEVLPVEPLTQVPSTYSPVAVVVCTMYPLAVDACVSVGWMGGTCVLSQYVLMHACPA